jgi:hypothetical protein
MEKVGRKFKSFAEAEQAERDYYRSLTPQQRLDLMLDIIRQGAPDEAFQRLERVCRIVKLHES